MKTSLLLSVTGITLVALTATTLYAQTVAGTSLVDKMKAAVHTFTLADDLNAGQTGLESAPIAGKKTGNMLTAGEWNRVLELIGEGGGGCTPSSGDVYDSGWVPFTRGQEINLTHNLGTLDTIVYLEYKAGPTPDTAYLDPNTLNSLFLNHGSYIYWNEKKENTIKLLTEYNAYDVGIRYFKVVMWKKSAIGGGCGGSSSGGSAQIVEGGIIKTSTKTISNWDLITLEGSWNGGSDAAPSGGYIYKLNGQSRLSYVEASGISKDITLTTTAQNVHNLTVKLSGDSVIIDPSSTNTLAYVVWKFGGGSSGSNGAFGTAWVNFDGTESAITMKGASGIASVTKVSAGNYQINFSTPKANTDYGVICTSGPSPAYLCFPHAKTTTGVLIKTSNPTSNVDATYVSVVIN